MHEIAIARDIVAVVEEAAKGRTVARVTLEIGKLSGVAGDAILFCFDVVASGTGLEGTELSILEVEGRARCRSCGAEFETDCVFALCACGSRTLTILRGEELNVKCIEVSEAT